MVGWLVGAVGDGGVGSVLVRGGVGDGVGRVGG